MHVHALVQIQGLIVQSLPFHLPFPLPLHGLALGPLRLGRLQTLGLVAAIVVGPFAVWFVKRRIDRWEEGQRRESARRFAVDVAVTLAKSIQLCENVRLALQTSGRVPDDTVEAAIEALDASRRTLRLYLRRHIPLHELIPLAAAAEKRLGEGHQAMLALQDGPGESAGDRLYAGQLQTVRAELQSVVDRLRRLEPELGRAIAKVDAGWALSD